jgi:CheY-like chemotaxis protein
MNARILIVDDNPINLKLASDVLEACGFDIVRAVDADAEQAQRILADLVPDLILMDIALPGMDGLTLSAKLKTNPRLQAVPIVALTASAMKGDERRAIDSGCDGYITKPINTRQFPGQVAAYLPARA